MKVFEVPIDREQHNELTRLNDEFIEGVCASDMQAIDKAMIAMRKKADSICAFHGQEFLRHHSYSFHSPWHKNAKMLVFDKRFDE